MGESGFFKTTALGGFDKKTVLNYIDSLNEGFHKTELEHQEKLDEFTKAQESQVVHIKKLEAQLAEQNAKLLAVANQLEQERGVARQAQEMIATLDDKNRLLQKERADTEREVQIQLERGRQLQFKAESLDYKSKKYDELSTQIGDTLIEARQNAEQIVAAANDKADMIFRQANDHLKNLFTELGSFKNDSGRLRKSVEEILFVLNDRVDVMQEVVRSIEKRFSASATLDYVEEKETFAAPEDSVGYFSPES